MTERIWRGALGSFYKIEGGCVYVHMAVSNSWVISHYGCNLELFNEGVEQGYFKEVK